ncbi:MAG: hypothetical protein LBH43_13175, partial [Treponema sp.]|nr:hypothetical protein [Treponema sp.]
YVWVITVRAFEFYVDFHSFIVSLFALAVFLVHHTLYITFVFFLVKGLLESIWKMKFWNEKQPQLPVVLS